MHAGWVEVRQAHVHRRRGSAGRDGADRHGAVDGGGWDADSGAADEGVDVGGYGWQAEGCG